MEDDIKTELIGMGQAVEQTSRIILNKGVTQITLPQAMKHGDFITFYNGEFKHEILKLEIE